MIKTKKKKKKYRLEEDSAIVSKTLSFKRKTTTFVLFEKEVKRTIIQISK